MTIVEWRKKKSHSCDLQNRFIYFIEIFSYCFAESEMIWHQSSNDIKFSQHLFQRVDCSSNTNSNLFMLSNLLSKSRDKIISESISESSPVSHDDEEEHIIFSSRYIRKTMLKRKLTSLKDDLFQERRMNAAKMHKREMHQARSSKCLSWRDKKEDQAFTWRVERILDVEHETSRRRQSISVRRESFSKSIAES
jgi:hypothetical protein